MDTQGASELLYEPGDHVAICPTNENELVDAILSRVQCDKKPDDVIVVQVLQQRSTPLGKSVGMTDYKKWTFVEYTKG